MSAQSPASGTALVRYPPVLNGTVEGSVQILSAGSLTLNGGANVSGDLLVSGTPSVRVNGNPNFGGTLAGSGAAAPSGWQITLNGGANLGRLVTRTDPLPLPTVAPPPAPSGTRDVSINQAGQAIGEFATLRNLTLNGGAGARAIPPGTYGAFTANGGGSLVLGRAGDTAPAVYHLQRLTLNGGSALRLLGPVEITLAHGVSLNASLGEAAHPEWLVLRIANGGLTLNGGAALWGRVLAPSGTVILNGAGTLTGGLASDRLTLNGGSRLTLVPVATGQPPAVTLTAPADGADFVHPEPVTLVATPAGPAGSVSRVVFHNGPTAIGESTLAPFVFAWTGAQPGTHTLTARAYDAAGAFGESPPVTIRVQASLPYFADFETGEGYTTGPLDGQLAWTGSGQAEIVTGGAQSGDASLLLLAGDVWPMASQTFAPSTDHERVFTDFFLQPVFTPEPPGDATAEAEGAIAGFVLIDGRGELLAWNGAGIDGGQWMSTAFEVPLGQDGAPPPWLRITIRQDFVTRRWDLYANGRMLLANLGLTAEAAPHLLEFKLAGPLTGGTRLDNLYIGSANPLFADADRDGIDDAYELANGLDPTVDDRDGDLDGDGLSNVTEFILGTSADNRDSDGDGLPDGWEHLHGLDPRQAAQPDQDSDGDGLSDLEELAVGTNPRSADTDGDGLPDGWEIAHGFDPLSAGDASADADGDGVSNLAEYQAGTDPLDYYNGVLPEMVSLVGSNGELTDDGALEMLITTASGEPLANAPVTFQALEGGHLLAASPQEPGTSILSVRTNPAGIAKAYVKAGGVQP